MTQTHLTILTGGSRGMGLAMAAQLLRQGHTLVSIARSANPELEAIAQAGGATLEQWQQDLSQGEQAAQRLQGWLAAQGPSAFASATLINNAGVIPRIVPLSGSIVPVRMPTRVDLPAPLRPITPIRSPRRIRVEKSLRIVLGPVALS